MVLVKIPVKWKIGDGYKIPDVTYGCMEYCCVEEWCILVFFHLHTEDGHKSGQNVLGVNI